MDVSKIIDYFEHSFLKDLLANPSVTDISYNGQDIYYVDNEYGRLKSDISIDKIIAIFMERHFTDDMILNHFIAFEPTISGYYSVSLAR